MKRENKEALKKRLYKRTGANPQKFIDGGKRLAKEAKAKGKEKKEQCSKEVGAMVKDAVHYMCKKERGIEGTFSGFGKGKRGSAGTYVYKNGKSVRIDKKSIKQNENRSYTKLF